MSGRRGRRDEVNQGPELPVLVVVGAGRQTGRQLVPVLNQFKAILGDEPDIKYVHREDKIGAGKLEFTLFLYLVAPPAASPAEGKAVHSQGPWLRWPVSGVGQSVRDVGSKTLNPTR